MGSISSRMINQKYLLCDYFSSFPKEPPGEIKSDNLWEKLIDPKI